MFDSTNVYNKAFNEIKVNAVSGTLIKSHPKSFFKVFHMDSQYARNLFSEKPFVHVEWKDIEVVVLQSMLTGNDKFNMIAEIVFEKEYLDIGEEE